MKSRKVLMCVAVAFSCSTLVTAQTTVEQPPANAKFLGPVLIAALSSGIGSGVTSFIGSLFNKLSNMVFGDPYNQQGFNQQINGYQQQQFGINQQAYGNQQQFGMNQQAYGNQQQMQMQPQFQPLQQQPNIQDTAHNIQTNTTVISPPGDNITPAILYKIEQLDPVTFQSIRTFENVKSTPPSLESGNVFAITYEPNMPGQVRLENIDPQNVTTQLGTYNVVGRKSRRLPVTKGFQLSGAPGTEQINIYFTPCRPPEAQNQPGVVEFQKLPLCSNTQVTNLAKAGKAGGVKPKVVINMDSVDPSIAVGVSVDYTQNDLQNGLPVKDELKLINTGGI